MNFKNSIDELFDEKRFLKSEVIDSLMGSALMISFIVFVFSLFANCYCTGEKDCMRGFLALFLGWFGAPFAWMANPLLILSWIFISKRLFSLILSSCSIVFAISYLFLDEVYINEAGHLGKITSYGYGYFMWMLSMGIFLIANIIRFRYSNPNQN